MMFLEHDFYSNFSQSLQAGDTRLTNNIICDELSELIVHEPNKIFDLLEKVGVRANERISDDELADLLLKNLETNEKLRRGLSFLISERNELINSKTDEKSGRKYVEYVDKNLSTCFNKILGNENEKRKFKNDLMQSIKSKDSKVAERRRNVEKPNHFWRNTLVVIGVIGVGYLIYRNWDKISGKEKLAEGGDIPVAVVETGSTTSSQAATPSAEAVTIEAPANFQTPNAVANG